MNDSHRITLRLPIDLHEKLQQAQKEHRGFVSLNQCIVELLYKQLENIKTKSQIVLEFCSQKKTIDEISFHTKLPITETSSLLLDLQLDGLVNHDGSFWWKA